MNLDIELENLVMIIDKDNKVVNVMIIVLNIIAEILIKIKVKISKQNNGIHLKIILIESCILNLVLNLNKEITVNRINKENILIRINLESKNAVVQLIKRKNFVLAVILLV